MNGTSKTCFKGLLPRLTRPGPAAFSAWARPAGGRGLPLKQEEEAVAVLLVSLSALTVFLALYVFRSFDDNRLTSWQWTVSETQVWPMFLVLLTGILLAHVLSGITLPRRWTVAALFAASFMTAGIFWREPEVIIDAGRYFTQAKHLALFGVGSFVMEWGRAIPVWTDLPLVPFLYGLVFSIFGEDRTAVQVLTTLFFSGTVVLTYAIGRTLWNETVGVIAGVLLLGMPYLLIQVPLMLVDVPTMFFLTLAVFATIVALGRGGKAWLALASVTIGLSLLTKYSAWVMLSVLAVVFLVHLIERGWVIVGRAGAIMGVSGLLIAPAVLWKYGVFAEQIKLLVDYQAPGLQRWGESHLSTFFFQIHPFVTVAALGSVAVAVVRKDLRFLIVCWVVLLLMVLEVRRIRYVIPALPMLALMAAYGMRQLRNARIVRHLVACTVISALVTATFGYLPFLSGTSAVNLKDAGAYLSSIGGQSVEVIVLAQARSSVNPAAAVPILDLHTDKDIVIAGTSPDLAPPDSIGTSPVRFTWETPSPLYPKAAPAAPTDAAALAVISDGRGGPLPEPVRRRIAELKRISEFAVSDRVFRYKTIVTIYRPHETAGGRVSIMR